MNVKFTSVSILKMQSKKWFDQLQQLGCIVCKLDLRIFTPPDIHHIHKNGRRIDDFHTIPLCPTHHRLGIKTKLFVSRHPWKREFEKRYGTEMELLEKVKALLLR